MAPRSSIQLKSNLDDVVYKLESESTGILKVNSDGLVRSRDTLGRDLIIVSKKQRKFVVIMLCSYIKSLVLSSR